MLAIRVAVVAPPVVSLAEAVGRAQAPGLCVRVDLGTASPPGVLAAAFALADRLGDNVSLGPGGARVRCFDIAPGSALPGYGGNGRNRRELLAHTDGSGADVQVDYMLLACARAAAGGGSSLVVRLDEVLPRLALGTVDRLRERWWRQDPYAPESRPRRFDPVLDEAGGVSYHRERVERGAEMAGAPLPADRRAVLNLFDDALASAAVHFRLAPGQALLLDNRSVLHGREAFEGDRLLHRIWIARRR